MQQLKYLISTLLLLIVQNIFAQNTILVPSEENTIQAALDKAEKNTTILVSQGTYFENVIWPQDVDGIKLIGEQGSEKTIIDGSSIGRVLTMDGKVIFNSDFQSITTLTQIEGFTIKNGYLAASKIYGAGLFIENASPALKDLIIRDNVGQGLGGNSTAYGGGAYLSSFQGVIQNCEFLNNAITTESRSYGAGLFLSIIGDCQVRNCAFINNHGSTLSWCYGGGLHVRSSFSSNPILPRFTLSNCVVDGNSTTTEKWSYGGGVYLDNGDSFSALVDSCEIKNNTTNTSRWSYGGGISTKGTSEFRNTKFIRNSSEHGGGIIISNSFDNDVDIKMANCRFSQNSSLFNSLFGGSAIYNNDPLELTLENCVIDHNKGSCIYFLISGFSNPNESNLVLNHCTVAYNEGSSRIGNTELSATNSIFWANGDRQLKDNNLEEVDADINYCLVAGGIQGEQIIDTDPLFIDEYLLIPSENSVCLSSGIPINTINEDITGNPRILPVGSYPDLGAYEIDQYYAHVTIQFFLDENENGFKDVTEPFTSLGSIIAQEKTLYSNFRKEGLFIIAEQGPLKIEYNENWNPLWLTTTEKSFEFDVEADDFSEQIEIGLKPSKALSQLQTIIESDRFRCGEAVEFSLNVNNTGTVKEQGTVWLSVDKRLSDYTFQVDPDYVASAHLVGWDFVDLLPSESFKVEFVVVAPLVENADQVGEEYFFSSELGQLNRQAPPTYTAELRCSYDPNDKQVQPQREDNLVLSSVPQVYTIRFQNMGNDYARHVIVTDTLDAGLDLSTFELISTSHPEKLLVTFNAERAVKFEFQNIFLPDSLTNEPGSNGHITYTIKPKEDVLLNTIIDNTAHIYFDFNPAIITNTTKSIIVDQFPSVAAQDLESADLLLYPNPVADILYLSEKVDRVQISNGQGQIVALARADDKLDISHLIEGLYFVELKWKDKRYSERIVVLR